MSRPYPPPGGQIVALMDRKHPATRTAATTTKVRLKSIRETISELRKAVWPTRREVVRLTIMVLAVAAAVGLFLGAADYGFTQLTRLLLH